MIGGVIKYRFGALDLGRVRLAVAPLYELLGSFAVLRDPDRQALHLPWVQAAQRALDGVDLGLLDTIIPGPGHVPAYVPDFLSPPPAVPVPEFAGELERVRATPPEQVLRELRAAFAGRPMPAAGRALLADPSAGLDAVVATLAVYWERAMAPSWPRVRALLEAEIGDRATALAEGGPLGLFADLHPDLVWRDGVLEARLPHDADSELGGRGLLLVPSAFFRAPAVTFDRPWQPTIVYPAAGAGALWEPARDAPGRAALGALLGGRRAEILVALGRPVSTLDLAADLGASRGGVNEHLQILRRAGLVTPRRDGRAVRYRRTAAGDAVVAAAAASASNASSDRLD
jgi:DNA-binding transcriptional ArsR family regulator